MRKCEIVVRDEIVKRKRIKEIGDENNNKN